MKRWLFLIILAAGLVFLAGTRRLPAAAQSGRTIINVKTTADGIDHSGNCSLRKAVIAANPDTVVDGCPAGTGAAALRSPRTSPPSTVRLGPEISSPATAAMG